MTQNSFDLIVVGAGPGGYVAAIRAAQLGLNTAIVEAEHLGGICLNWGCIPTKVLLASAQMYQQFNHAQQYGLTADNIGFDLDKIVQRSRDVSAKLTGGIAHLLKKNQVTVINGFAKLSLARESSASESPNDHQLIIENNEGNKEGQSPRTISAPHIILATGARARSFPGLTPDGDRVWNYKQALVPKQMPKSLLVIGSGAIGIEFANFYHALGCEVTVVEAQKQIMPVEDQEIALVAQKAMAKRGIKFHTNSKVTKLDRQAEQVVASIQQADDSQADSDKSDNAQTITVENVISATGVQPNSEQLNLEQYGVMLDKQGFIDTNDYCQTSIKGIYAIGDVAGAPCLAHKASHEGILCVENIVNKGHVQPLDKNRIPACTYSFPQVASIGLTEQQARDQRLEIKLGRFPFQANGKAIAQGETEGLIKVIFDQTTGELLGAHMVGSEVTELIHGFAIGKTLETTEEELMHTVFPHPTLSEMVHESVLEAYARAIHV